MRRRGKLLEECVAFLDPGVRVDFCYDLCTESGIAASNAGATSAIRWPLR